MNRTHKLPMTDLEEDILFLLARQREDLSVISIIDLFSKRAGPAVFLAEIHRTCVQLEHAQLVEVSLVNLKRHYRITKKGLAALQRDWNYHRKQLRDHAKA